MVKRILLLLSAVVLVAVGVATFAAYESHMVNVKAHIEKATYLDKLEIDYGTAFPEQKLEGCDLIDSDQIPSCVEIRLTPSFIEDSKQDVTYDIYWERKAGYPYPICPFIVVSDSDNPNEDDADQITGNCYTTVPTDTVPVKIGAGELNKVTNDLTDLWDLTFWVPVCVENYNPLTDAGPTIPDGMSPTVAGCSDPAGLGGSYGEIDLGSDLKFQITAYSP